MNLDDELRASVNHCYRMVSADIEYDARKAVIVLPFWTTVYAKLLDGKISTRTVIFGRPIVVVFLAVVSVCCVLMLTTFYFLGRGLIGTIAGTLLVLLAVAAGRHASGALMATGSIRAVLRKHWLAATG